MYFWIFGILVSHSMESLSMESLASQEAFQSVSRDYANKIGMICSHNLSDPSESFFMEIGENDRIDDVLEKFGTNRKIIFFVNGYGENMNPDDDKGYSFRWFKSFTYGLLKDDSSVACAFDFNRLQDMGPACLIACYWNAVKSRVPFASKIIKMIAAEMYAKNVFSTFEDFELVGFSLGAHIAGLAARKIKTEMGMEVSKIFALDPAKKFLNQNSKKQLQKTDARYVQAMITSSIGQSNIDVHCKIFINDGATQPGCEDKIIIALQFCSHRYAIDLFKRIASREIELIAYKDPDENVGVENVPNEMTVGHHSQENAFGVFFANTDHSKVKKPRHNRTN